MLMLIAMLDAEVDVECDVGVDVEVCVDVDGDADGDVELGWRRWRWTLFVCRLIDWPPACPVVMSKASTRRAQNAPASAQPSVASTRRRITETRETVCNRLCSTIASTTDLLSLLNVVEITGDQHKALQHHCLAHRLPLL